MMSVVSTMFAEKEEEVELSEEVLVELGKREAQVREREDLVLEAAVLIQGIYRQKKTKKAFQFLRRMAIAVRLVNRFFSQWRRRRRRNAALKIQTAARAYVLHKLGICERSTALAVISGTRSAYHRSLNRMVQRRVVLFQLEQKRRKAAQLVSTVKKSRGGVVLKSRALISPAVSERGGVSERSNNSDPMSAIEAARRLSEPTEAAKRSGASLVSSLVPRGLTMARPPTITGRIPMMAPKKAFGTPPQGSTPYGGNTPHKVTPRSFPAGSGGGFGTRDIEAGPPASDTPSRLMPNPVLSLNIPGGGVTGMVAAAAARATAAAMAAAPGAANILDVASSQALERRRNISTAAMNALHNSFGAVEGGEAADELPAGYVPPVRKLFPPGASASKFNTFYSSEAGSRLVASLAGTRQACAGGPLQTSTSYAGLPMRRAAELSAGSADDDLDAPSDAAPAARSGFRTSVSTAALPNAVPRLAINQMGPRLSKAAPSRYQFDPSQEDLDGPDIGSLAAPDDLEGGYRLPVRRQEV